MNVRRAGQIFHYLSPCQNTGIVRDTCCVTKDPSTRVRDGWNFYDYCSSDVDILAMCVHIVCVGEGKWVANDQGRPIEYATVN